MSGRTFGTHTAENGPNGNGLMRWRIEFPNGYGASIVNGPYAYGGNYEVAVMRDGRLCYDTPVTDDVVGYLDDEDDVAKVLDAIAALPHATAVAR